MKPLTDQQKKRIRDDTNTKLAMFRMYNSSNRYAHMRFPMRKAWEHRLVNKAETDFQRLVRESWELRYSRPLPRFTS